ncbi:hypothetical protein RvY_03559 [Ramazzottius varieornatus]|uniref:Uncharacterized protein n=1 Tax=Ramazzottius varieornatus TaxID=947166 RepID=A0A1D1UNH3_RAMVA|nr:hypothetical protein RvY_03559 [Ramazzottius varieornatus]
MKTLVNGQKVIVGYFFKDISSPFAASTSSAAATDNSSISRHDAAAATQNGFRKVAGGVEASTSQKTRKDFEINNPVSCVPQQSSRAKLRLLTQIKRLITIFWLTAQQPQLTLSPLRYDRTCYRVPIPFFPPSTSFVPQGSHHQALSSG